MSNHDGTSMHQLMGRFGAIEELPNGCFAILVHRHYVERVKDAMMKTNSNDDEVNNRHSSWQQLFSVDATADTNVHLNKTSNVVTAPTKKPKIMTECPSCQTIELPQQQRLKGGRKDRRRYELLLFQHSPATSLMMELSPLARQNISWAAPIQYRISNHNDNDVDAGAGCSIATKKNRIGVALFQYLLHNQFDFTRHVLRIDTFPPEQGADTAKALQLAASASLVSLAEKGAILKNEDDDPYSGPIEMTRSVSKCTHVLTVLKVTTTTTPEHPADSGGNNNSNNSHNDAHFYYIGLALQAGHVSLLLNHYASRQVWVEPTDEQTGLDLGHDIPPHAPVSRAYYKLLQVWQEYLQSPSSIVGTTNPTIGLDLGAAPGGWTQVLLEHFRLSHVVAVDTARHLAHRIVQHPTTRGQVTHVQADLSKKLETAQAIQQAMLSQAPAQQPCSISHVVCDSSTDSHRILSDVVQLIEQLSLLPFVTWTRPSFWVVTLKLPYKTSQSVQRNLDRVVDTIPDHLRRIAALCYREEATTISAVAQVEYQVVHLMANSDSERTLIAVVR